jgi:hypothetical protein
MSNDKTNSATLPSNGIRVISPNAKNLLKQDYEDQHITHGTIADFNTHLEGYQGFIFGFMGPLDNFVSPDVLTEVANIFRKFPNVSAVYTDLTLAKNGNSSTQFFPMASYDIFDRQIINPPIFWKPATTLIRFDERFSHLYFHDFLKKARTNHFMYHIAKPLIERTITTIDVTPDLHLLQQNQNA